MQYLYDAEAGKRELYIKGELHKYLFKVRRLKEGKVLSVRNLRDGFLYFYEIVNVSKKEALLKLTQQEKNEKKGCSLHLIWCMIDTKVIEKTLPMLNQIGVSKISFLYCDRSQKNFILDKHRIEKILINSSQQCGRTDMMQIEHFDTLEKVLSVYREIQILDFDGKQEGDIENPILIGCEGGFTEKERIKLENQNKIGLKTDLILKSETAVVAIASKLLI